MRAWLLKSGIGLAACGALFATAQAASAGTYELVLEKHMINITGEERPAMLTR